ncbi:DUF2946 family protein [Ancylobacter sp. TS-1]|uniref:DUF2946 family protein n=1 Tax=Ancylobacter sp. TS-1 TaxID=1850374 RepID=UPI001265B67F|nr:DUF2946 family protein [Ancylobacter sp. TS-1]QFR32977.1 hypothetical protein GBB76_07450 [Ancylobacter sp. TS-1]
MITHGSQPDRRTPATALRRLALVIAVAYLLVLQSLLGGLAGGAHAAGGIAVDAFGQVICSGAHDAPSSPADPARHTPDCCTTGCQTAAGAALPPPSAAVPAQPAARLSARVTLPRASAPALQPERTPRHTRAPPLA